MGAAASGWSFGHGDRCGIILSEPAYFGKHPAGSAGRRCLVVRSEKRPLGGRRAARGARNPGQRPPGRPGSNPLGGPTTIPAGKGRNFRRRPAENLAPKGIYRYASSNGCDSILISCAPRPGCGDVSFCPVRPFRDRVCRRLNAGGRTGVNPRRTVCGGTGDAVDDDPHPCRNCRGLPPFSGSAKIWPAGRADRRSTRRREERQVA